MFNLLTTKQAFLDAQGNPLSGGRLWTKVSGSNTNKATTKDADGLVPNTNPIILDTRGEVPFGVYGTTGAYRLVLTTPGDTTDPPTSPIWGPRDGVSGINDLVTASLEWLQTGLTPTFTGTNSFTVLGDQTATFQVRRRVRATVGSGFRHGTIQDVFFSGNTQVTLVPDITGTGLDASLSAVAVGILTATNTSQPLDSSRGLDIASAGTLTLPANADRFNITGTATINTLAGGWVGRRVYLTHAGVQPLTHSTILVLPGGLPFTTAVDDETVWEQTNITNTWKLINYNPASAARSVMTLDKEVATLTVVNTTTVTKIASVNIPAGVLVPDGIATWNVFGNILNNSGASNNLSFIVQLAGGAIWQDFITVTTSATRRAFVFEFSIASKNSATVQSGGGLASVSLSVAPSTGLGSIASTNFADSAIASSNTDSAANMAIAQLFDISVQWGIAHALSEVVRKFAVCTLE